jgi:hypothetical protein
MSVILDTSFDAFCSRFEVRPNSNKFTPAEALAAAKTLKRHLEQWHVPDRDSSPVKWAKFVEAERMKRVTFRQEATKGKHKARSRTVQFFIPGLIAGNDGAALENPDRLTDHSVTLWLVREFYERLAPLRKNPLWQYLAITFDDLLDEPCFVYREPDPHLDHEFQWVKPGWWAVVGKPVPVDLLSDLVEAASRPIERPGDQKKIPPAKRTRPMSLREAARLMGYGKSRDAAEKLRAAIDVGAVPCETLTRQQHVFSLDFFPQGKWPQAKP